MAERIAPRHRIAIELLDIQPGDRILEIGCGAGVATTLALGVLGAGGHLTAIDRSEKMAAAAAKRNADAVAAGRLGVMAGDFETADLDHSFDRVFAVNVDFPRHRDIGWADRLSEIVVPGGLVVLLLEAPAPAIAERFGAAAAARLAARGFAVEIVARSEVVSVRAVAPA